jgi:hypothetical protein
VEAVASLYQERRGHRFPEWRQGLDELIDRYQQLYDEMITRHRMRVRTSVHGGDIDLSDLRQLERDADQLRVTWETRSKDAFRCVYPVRCYSRTLGWLENVAVYFQIPQMDLERAQRSIPNCTESRWLPSQGEVEAACRNRAADATPQGSGFRGMAEDQWTRLTGTAPARGGAVEPHR